MPNTQCTAQDANGVYCAAPIDGHPADEHVNINGRWPVYRLVVGSTGAQLAAISAWVDNHPPNRERDAEARLWGRCAKVVEEAGEVIQAIIAMTGQSPRKGQSGCVADVLDELLDVAATALAAVEHIGGNRGDSLDLLAEHVAGLVERAGLSIPHPTGGAP